MTYTVFPTEIPEVLILESQVFEDNRGFFFESFNQKDFLLATGIDLQFVQDNYSSSVSGVLRGLHYQIEKPQGKLVRVLSGTVFDVAVDLRRSSPNFSKWVGVELSSENKRQLWIPPGFAHGFLVKTKTADLQYKTTDYWDPSSERILLWNDPTIGVKWPTELEPNLAPKDLIGDSFNNANFFE